MLNQTEVKKLSANKLAEYVDAKPSRRETIVNQRIKEQGHALNYYGYATNAINRVLIRGSESRKIHLVSEMDRMTQEVGMGLYPKSHIKNNMEALQSFSNFIGNWEEGDCVSFRKPSTTLEAIEMSGLIVSNSMSVEILTKAKTVKYGAVKLYLNKKHPLSEFSGDVLSAMFYSQVCAAKGRSCVSRKHVVVLDVFAKRMFCAPVSYKRLNNEAMAAAREVVIRWDSLIH